LQRRSRPEIRRSIRIPSQPQEDVGGDPGGGGADYWAAVVAVAARLVEGLLVLRILQAVGAAELERVDLGADRVAEFLVKAEVEFRGDLPPGMV
jgi:hypothetical protein